LQRAAPPGSFSRHLNPSMAPKIGTRDRLDGLQSLAKARAYYVLRRCLSQANRDRLKRWQNSGRMRMSGVLSLLHGSYTSRELVLELNSRLPRDFEILMVHSAFDRLLPAYKGTPREVIESLVALCGNQRTLVMPAFCLGGKSRDKRAFYKTHPFDVKRSP